MSMENAAHARDAPLRVRLKVLSACSLELTIHYDAVSLLTLPDVLQLEIAKVLHDPGDCGALCVAIPPIGLLAIRGLPQYGDPLVSVAMRLATDDVTVMNEMMMRKYVSYVCMTDDGCEWLTAAAQRAGSPLRIQTGVDDTDKLFQREIAHPVFRDHLRVAVAHYWRLTDGGAEGPLVRAQVGRGFPVMPHWAGMVILFAGEQGSERVVSMEYPALKGRLLKVAHFEGPRGAEQKVRMVDWWGSDLPGAEEWQKEWCTWSPRHVSFFEGEQGSERLVRRETRASIEASRGRRLILYNTEHYEGPIGAERKVRETEWSDGTVTTFEACFEGDRIRPYKVLEEKPDGTVIFFEGGCSERKVRQESPDGTVAHYAGPAWGERLVRLERFDRPRLSSPLRSCRLWSACRPASVCTVIHYNESELRRRIESPDGTVLHFEGDDERLVRKVYPDGTVFHYEGEGEGDAERLVTRENPDGSIVRFLWDAIWDVRWREQGVGWKRRTELPDGTVVLAEGGPPRWRVRKELPDGSVVHYEEVEGEGEGKGEGEVEVEGEDAPIEGSA